MKAWTSMAYFAVVAAAVACATLQPSHASAVEEDAVALGAALWPADADEDPATARGAPQGLPAQER